MVMVVPTVAVEELDCTTRPHEGPTVAVLS